MNGVATTGKSAPPSSSIAAAAPAIPEAREYDFALDLPGACCFCASSRGLRIKCQHLDCGLFFHAMCAHERNGRVEIRCAHSPLAQYHAYCARHRESALDAQGLLEKMMSKPIAALVGRDSTRTLQTIRRRLDASQQATVGSSSKTLFYPTIDAFFSATATVLVDLCKKGLRASKADPPVYNSRHLQALQFFLDHVPQLQVLYGAPRVPTQRVVQQAGGDSELYALLQKTYNPQKYYGKYAGPVSQVHACHVCAEPFHERQHLFYCSHAATPHVQHWKCTKRRSNSREREKLAVATVAAAASSSKKAASSSSSTSSSSKKKLKSISLVVNGQWRDVKLPKGLPGVSDELICGVCRSDVYAHGLIGSRKEGKRADFEKKKSNFVLGGCFMNPADTLRAAARVTPAATAAAAGRPPVAPKAEAKATAKSSDRRGTKRNASAMESSKAASKPATAAVDVKVAAAAAAAMAAPVLGPPKMERINVQRTAKWLAYVAQIIRLAGTVAKMSSTAADAADAGAMTDAGESNVSAEAATAEEKMSEPATSEVPGTAAANGVAAQIQDQAQEEAGETKKDEDGTTASTDSAEPVVEADIPVACESHEPLPKPRVRDIRSEIARLNQAIETYFDEAMQIVRPFDAYVLSKLEAARGYLRDRNGPAVGVLRMLAQEYTRFVYVKHTRAVEKASNEKRRREEQAAQELRDQERKRLEREAELALKAQMLAMRKKQRKVLKLGQ